MRPWIKRWRDWAMNDPPAHPSSAQAQSMHYSYEKAGLVIENQPIPWNAETVIMEVPPVTAISPGLAEILSWEPVGAV